MADKRKDDKSFLAALKDSFGTMSERARARRKNKPALDAGFLGTRMKRKPKRDRRS